METATVVKRLRWIMVAVIFVDAINTLLGQPHAYWSHPSAADEATPLVHFFAVRGCVVFILYWLLYTAGAFFLVSLLPGRLALTCVFIFIFPHYFGATWWWVYHWNYGSDAATIYGIALSVFLVMVGFPGLKHFTSNDSNA
jgi:hypothetical protein